MGLSNGLNGDASRDLNNMKDNVLPIVPGAGDGVDREDDIPNDESDYESDQEYENALDAARNMQKSLVVKLDRIVAQNEIIMQQNNEILRLVRASQLSFDRLKLPLGRSPSP